MSFFLAINLKRMLKQFSNAELTSRLIGFLIFKSFASQCFKEHVDSRLCVQRAFVETDEL